MTMTVTPKDQPARLHLILRGRVQGVFFRRATLDEAQALGITGWVRNLASGEVEIVAEGRRDHLKVLSAWAQIGPPGARVEDAVEEWEDFRNEFSSFRVR
jgi:acylphosphatase